MLSAAGNDFIDAARDPAPGQGILKNMPGLPAPAQGRDCVKQDVVALLITQYLDPHFAKLYDLVQGDKHADMPIFLNSYDTPTAQDPTEDSGDWINEIHPNAAGWEKLPVLWHGAVKAMLK